MAFSSLFTLLDDITAVLDDVSIMSKVAAKKTAGVIGDDLALNANQVSGKDTRPERELPIVWAVAKGSLLNKIILIPLALLLSIYLPQAITVLLLLGGAYLCFEGAEKVLHSLFHRKSSEHRIGYSTRFLYIDKNPYPFSNRLRHYDFCLRISWTHCKTR